MSAHEIVETDAQDPDEDGFLARSVQIAAPVLSEDDTCGDAFSIMTAQPDWPCIAICDEDQRVIGVLDRLHFLSTFGQTYGRAVYEKRPVTSLMREPALIVDELEDIDEVGRLIADEHPQAFTAGFVVTRKGRYLGIGVPIRLLSKASERAHIRARALGAAHREAQAANEAKSAFLATMSHEIRTPLNGIIGNLELLSFTELAEKQADLASNAEVSAHTLLSIIGDVLDFSKIEAGRIDLESVETQPSAVVEEILAMLGSKATQKGIDLTAFVGPRVPGAVMADQFRLQQVLMNFVSNAIKFTDSGRVQINLSAPRKEGKDRVWLRYEVVDTGKGFAPEKAETLFEAFQQEDSSTTRQFGGTGLGLAICKKIVELMGGKVGAVGVPGAGATFWAEIPVPRHVKSMTKNPDIQGIRAMLVDEKASEDRIEFGDTLIATVGKVADARRLAEEQLAAGKPFEVALISESLRDGDAFELTEPLLATGCTLFLTTSNTAPALRHQAYRVGFAHVLEKPLDERMINHLLAWGAGRINLRSAAAKKTSLRDRIAQINVSEITNPILVIDDTAMNRVVAQGQLTKLGLTTDEAENGEAALRKATENDYSLIFVDCSMPVMDGYEFTRRFRAWEVGRPRRTPVIAMTGNVLESDRQRCAEAGMDDFLSKPVTLERMASTLTQWLGADASAQASGGSPAPLATPDAAADPTVTTPTAPAPVSRETTADAKPAAVGAMPVDLKALGDLLGDDDPEMISEMLGLFLEHAHDLLGGVLEAVRSESREETEARAHAAKGAARNVCAQELALHLEGLEHSAKTEPWDSLRERAAAVETSFSDVLGFVEGRLRAA